MADANETREYLHDLTLCCLHLSGQECTAAEIAEHMGTLALSEGHPKIVGLSAQVVAGYLRTLLNDGKVRRGNGARNPRHGRDEATWLPAAAFNRKYPVPDAPDPDAVSTPASPQRGPAAEVQTGSPYDHLSKEQLVALLHIQDEISLAAARFQEDIERIKVGARTRLAILGVR